MDPNYYFADPDPAAFSMRNGNSIRLQPPKTAVWLFKLAEFDPPHQYQKNLKRLLQKKEKNMELQIYF